MPSMFGIYNRRQTVPRRAGTFGLSQVGATSGALGRQYAPQTLPEYAPAHPSYQAPMGATTLPMRVGMPTQAPRPLGIVPGQNQFMPYQGGGGYQVPPKPGPQYGAGIQGPPTRGPFDVPIERSYLTPDEQQRAIDNFDHPSLFEPLPQRRTQAEIARDPEVQRRRTNRMLQEKAFTSGLQYATPAPWTGSMQGEVDRQRMYDAAAGSGPYDSPSALGRFQSLQGTQPTRTGFGGMVTRDTIGTPNAANIAYAERADNKAAGLREGRRNRAIAKYGLTHLQPTQNYTYNPQTNGYDRASTAFGAPASRGVSDLVARNTVTSENGATETNWGNVTRSIYDDPNFKNNPKAAWDEIRKSGMTSADIAALIDDAEGGPFGFGSDQDAAYIAWLQGLGQSAGIQGAATPPEYAPGPLGSPGVMGIGGEVAPPLPRDSRVVRPPVGSAAPPPAPHGEGGVGIPDIAFVPPSAPPPTPPRRRPGPRYGPNF